MPQVAVLPKETTPDAIKSRRAAVTEESWAQPPASLHHVPQNRSRDPEATRPLHSGQNSQQELLQTRLRRHENFDRDHSLSWLHCFISIFSYSLLLTDIARAGLGTRHLNRSFLSMEPDSYMIFGPYAYPVVHLTVQNATMDEPMGFWPYKYDSTSIAMRAFAQFLKLSTWPPCVSYKKQCDESKGIRLQSLFAMVDSLVGGIRAHRVNAQQTRGHLTLRAECTDRDRLHHYAFPWFFQLMLKRTNQAVYHSFNSSQLTALSTVVCKTTTVTRRPYSCNEQWTHFRRVLPDELASISPTGSQSNFRVWEEIPVHLKALASAYPNHVIEFVVLDSMEDPSRGALSFQGRRYFDVVVLSRVRKCLRLGNSSSEELECTTVAVDDYRYEGASFTMDAPSWFPVVASLRILGQIYTWMRVFILIGSCYVVCRRQNRSASRLKQIRSTVRTFFLIPSQVVIYGSWLPISLYAVAHLIDSPAVYEVVDAHFNSWLGEVNMNWGDFLQLCAVSMRTVWILSTLCHGAQLIATRCSWSPAHGVVGMTELSITLLASVTLLAKYRSVTFRNNEILQLHEVTVSTRRHELLRSRHQLSPNTPTSLVFGSTLDRQCLLCAFLLLLTVIGVCKVLNRLAPARFPFRVALYSRTLVPYSAGMMWPCNHLVVSWYSTLVQHVPADEMKAEAFHHNQLGFRGAAPATFRSTAIAALQVDRQVRTGIRLRGLVMRHTRASELIQRDMQSVNQRSRHVQSMVMLVNLAVITDPITFLTLRKFRGQRVGLFECRVTGSCHLLPLCLVQFEGDIPIEWRELTLLVALNSEDLDWNDLLLCG